MKQLPKTLIAGLMALVLVLGMLPGRAQAAESFNPDFDEWLYDEWIATMESDYLNMHYSVKDYRAYNITKPEVTLGTVSYEDYAESVQECIDTLEVLEGFDYDSLSESQKADYDTYHFYLEKMQILNEYPEFDEYFNPYTGGLTNMETNFTEFVFYEKEDIDDYLTLLADYPRLIADMLTFTERQAEDGYFMLDSTLDEAEAEIEEFVAKGEENPLIIIFNERVEAFPGLSDGEIQNYEARNKSLVLDQILPTYESTETALEALRGSRSQQGGLWGYENGSEYYTALAQYKSSTDYLPEEIYDKTIDSLNVAVDYINEVIDEWSSHVSGGLYLDEVSFTTATEMLEHLKRHLDKFPEGPEVNYTASFLDPSIANPSVTAYYMTTPLDDITDNVIRINESAVADDLNGFYMTLSHEGYPGHLYQFTWYLNTNPNPIRASISTMGYQEGWAMYVEGLMIHEAGIDDYSATYLEINEYYSYLYNVLLDIGVNGLGWDVNDLYEWMKEDGNRITMAEAQSYYDYFASVPGIYLSYGFGQLMFLELADEAKVAFGDDFDYVTFHEQLLTNGPRPFTTVQRELEAFIAEQGYMIPAEGTYGTYWVELYGLPGEAGIKIENLSPALGDEDPDAIESPDGLDTTEATEGVGRGAANNFFRGIAAFVLIALAIVVLILVIVIIVAVAVSRNKKKKQQEQLAWQQQQQWQGQQWTGQPMQQQWNQQSMQEQMPQQWQQQQQQWTEQQQLQQQWEKQQPWQGQQTPYSVPQETNPQQTAEVPVKDHGGQGNTSNTVNTTNPGWEVSSFPEINHQEGEQ